MKFEEKSSIFSPRYPQGSQLGQFGLDVWSAIANI